MTLAHVAKEMRMLAYGDGEVGELRKQFVDGVHLRNEMWLDSSGVAYDFFQTLCELPGIT
jgi:hypothetical protein